MTLPRLKELLDENDVKYTVTRHSPAYTAQEVAEETHIPGRQFAKTVVIKLDGQMAMAVLPAPLEVDLMELEEAVGAGRVELAKEEDFLSLFPDCDPGMMPPFGNLYGLQVFSSAALGEDDRISFNAGRDDEVMTLPYEDYVRLVKPRVVPFAEPTSRRA